MFTRAVILPATPLLIPGAAGVADPLGQVRLAACAALAVLAETGPPLVLAARPGRTRGPLRPRPSLAAAGIADHMLADDVVAPWEHHGSRPPAGTAASTLLLCLGAALGARAADVPVLEVSDPVLEISAAEVAGTLQAGPAAVVTEHLAAGGTLVIGSGSASRAAGADRTTPARDPELLAVDPAGDGEPPARDVVPSAADTEPRAPDAAQPDLLAPAISAVLAAAGVATWTPDTRVFPQELDHLPAAYFLTVLAAPGVVA